MKIILPVFLLLFSLPAVAMDFHFTYMPNDGTGLENGGVLSCTHKQIRDLPDYDVSCGNGEKKYTVHLIVRQMNRDQKPKTAFEILYWVTEPGETPTSIHKFHSTSLLLSVKEQSDLDHMILSQGVENDYASLELSLGN